VRLIRQAALSPDISPVRCCPLITAMLAVTGRRRGPVGVLAGHQRGGEQPVHTPADHRRRDRGIQQENPTADGFPEAQDTPQDRHHRVGGGDAGLAASSVPALRALCSRNIANPPAAIMA